MVNPSFSWTLFFIMLSCNLFATTTRYARNTCLHLSGYFFYLGKFRNVALISAAALASQGQRMGSSGAWTILGGISEWSGDPLGEVSYYHCKFVLHIVTTVDFFHGASPSSGLQAIAPVTHAILVHPEVLEGQFRNRIFWSWLLVQE